VTNNIEGRIYSHNEGTNDGYTKSRRPVKLLKSFYFNDIRYAIAFEKQIKRW
jgi:putative endonuclease